MLDIKITDKLKITSDERNYILSRLVNKKTDYWKNIGYYPTFEMAACELIEAHIRALDARNLSEVISAIEDLKHAVIRSQRL